MDFHSLWFPSLRSHVSSTSNMPGLVTLPILKTNDAVWFVFLLKSTCMINCSYNHQTKIRTLVHSFLISEKYQKIVKQEKSQFEKACCYIVILTGCLKLCAMCWPPSCPTATPHSSWGPSHQVRHILPADRARIFKQSVGAQNRVGIGLSYLPTCCQDT